MYLGPIFVPSADDKLETMLKLDAAKKGEKIIDIGCGDGKIIIELAQRGFHAEGIDFSPRLIKQCREKANKLGVQKNIEVSVKNFWDVDLSKYDIIFFYGMTHVMKRMEKKLEKEMKPGARFISNYFHLPNWKPVIEENEIRVYQKN